MLQLSKLLSLSQAETLKLVIFQEQPLQETLIFVEHVLSGKSSLKGTINDVFSWLMSLCIRKSKEFNCPIDYPWHYDLCEMLNRQPLDKHISRSLRIPEPLPTQGAYAPYSPEKASDTHIKTQLEYDIKRYSEILSNPDTFLPNHMAFPREFFVMLAKQNLASCLKEYDRYFTP